MNLHSLWHRYKVKKSFDFSSKLIKLSYLEIMSKMSQHCKYLHLVYTSNSSGPLFHTSRNPVIPNIARGENYNAPDYLYCLRPAKVPEVDVPNLAGEPRSCSDVEGIKPEVVEKWNQRPKQDIYKEWNKLAVFY